MLLPTRMTRVVLGGHKEHMAAVLETLHDEKLVHLEDYQDPTGSTQIGTPLEAGDVLSARLVRARGLQKALDVESVAPAGRADDPEAALQEVEAAVHPVMDHLSKTRQELSQNETEAAVLAPFADLEVELAGVGGLRSVRGMLGTTRDDPRPVLRDAAIEVDLEAAPYGTGYVVAAFCAADAGDALEAALATAGFTPANLAQGSEGTPAARLATLSTERERLQGAVAEGEAQLAALASGWGPRLAAVERVLASEVAKTQAPLQFAVTKSTFHAEGWLPKEQANRLRNALSGRFGDSVYFDDLGDGPRSAEAHEGHEDHHDDPADEAPVKLENRGLARPYEFLLGLLGRPRYHEIDPTKLMLIFFPLFFGLMVGDVVVGLAIMAFGLWLKNNNLFGIGGPAVGRTLFMGGVMAVLVGAFVFGEGLGIHFVVDPHGLEEGEISWESIIYGKEEVMTGAAGFPTTGFIHKIGHAEPVHLDDHGEGDHGDTSQGHAAENGTAGDNATAAGHEAPTTGFTTHAEETESASLFAPHAENHLSLNGWVNLGYYSKVHDIQALLLWSVMIGIVHLVLGFVIGFRNVAVSHGATLAVQEKASWLMIMAAVPVAVMGSVQGQTAVMAAGIGLLVVAIGLLWVGTAKVLGVGFVSVLEVLGLAGNILSYTRIAAIGASKAGIAIAFLAIADLASGGALNALWWAVYIFGMIVITLLAMLSGGLQSLRLQFVEFFQKFYTGGGRLYVPFGRRAP